MFFFRLHSFHRFVIHLVDDTNARPESNCLPYAKWPSTILLTCRQCRSNEALKLRSSSSFLFLRRARG